MRSTAIIGVGMTPVGEHWDMSLRALAADAGQQALKDAGLEQVDALYIGNGYSCSFSSQTQLGALIADYMGLDGVEALSVEAGEASGAAAVRFAHLAVASGAIESALVVGVEKATDMVGSARVKARNVSLDADYESAHGATLPAMAALLMRRYMHEYGVDLSVFEGFSINAHANGRRSQYAMFRNTLKPGAFAAASMIAEPVNLFDSAPDADGAAALVIVPADRAVDLAPAPVRIAASSASTDALTLQDRKDMLFLSAAERSVSRGLSAANIDLRDIDLFELHDAFTILSALSLEAAGFAERGKGWELAKNYGEALGLANTLPVSTFGGLKSRGNPLGATGVYQAVEACLQLQGRAGDNQVKDAQIAMIQNLAGLGSTAITHILEASR